MRPSEILELQRRRPFTGLRIQMSVGQSYDVLHPDMMMVTATLVHIALPQRRKGVPLRSVYCDPNHITRVEPMNDARPRRRTGRSKK